MVREKLGKIRFTNYIIVGIVFFTALIQFISSTRGLTRWKGGGYGMYSELHYPIREIWLLKRDTNINLSKLYLTKKEKRLVVNVQRFPNTKTIQELTHHFKSKYKDTFEIEVWTPNINIAEGSICKTKVYPIK